MLESSIVCPDAVWLWMCARRYLIRQPNSNTFSIQIFFRFRCDTGCYFEHPSSSKSRGVLPAMSRMLAALGLTSSRAVISADSSCNVEVVHAVSTLCWSCCRPRWRSKYLAANHDEGDDDKRNATVQAAASCVSPSILLVHTILNSSLGKRGYNEQTQCSSVIP